MNKLEKVRNTSCEVIECQNDENIEKSTEQEESKDKKTYSFFTFWKKINTPKDREEEEIVEGNEVEKGKTSAIYKFLNKRTTVLAACVLVIAVAGYLNVRFSNPAKTLPDNAVSDSDVGDVSLSDNGDQAAVDETEDYFALAVINRERVRDEAIEMLKEVAASDSTDVSAKNEAYAEMSRMANEIANEANIESLVKAKGFSECVAVVSNDSANVIVESDGLTINQVAQIKEIVYIECGILPDNIKIIEKENI